MVVLVCGGRNFSDWKRGWEELDKINSATPITKIVNGGASGADRMASVWADRNGITKSVYSPEWLKYGKIAGHIRNGVMLRFERPNLVVAFPGGNGTADMIEQAGKWGAKVVRPLEESDERTA